MSNGVEEAENQEESNEDSDIPQKLAATHSMTLDEYLTKNSNR